MEKQNSIPVIGVDAGRSGVRVAFGSSRFECSSVQSLLGSGRTLDDKQKPRITLCDNGLVYVFGNDDVFGTDKTPAFGAPGLIQNNNHDFRYGSPEHIMLIKAGLINGAPRKYLNQAEPISPLIGLTIPIQQYNDSDVNYRQKLTDAVAKITVIEDAYGNTLNLDIRPKNVIIFPEGQPAFVSWAFNWKTGSPNKGTSTVGISVGLEGGFGTYHIVTVNGVVYQQGMSAGLEEAGMSVVVNAIVKALGGKVHPLWIDRAIRDIADVPFGKPKKIFLPGNEKVDVAPVYDPTLKTLAARVVSETLELTKTVRVARIVLLGGSMYHMKKIMPSLLPPSMEIGYGNGNMDNLDGVIFQLSQIVQRNGATVDKA